MKHSIGFLTFLTATAAHAATYNIYFNGTEQGDNSTATPTLNANAEARATGKESSPSKESGVETALMKVQPPGTVAAEEPKTPIAAPVTASTSVANENHEDRPGVPQEAGWQVAFQMNRSILSGGITTGEQVTLSRDLGQWIKLRGFFSVAPREHVVNGGWWYPETRYTSYEPYGGLDLVFSPIHISFFDMDNFIEVNTSIGAMTFGPPQWLPDAGVDLSVRVTSHLAVVAGARAVFGIGPGTRTDMAQIEAGIAMRF